MQRVVLDCLSKPGVPNGISSRCFMLAIRLLEKGGRSMQDSFYKLLTQDGYALSPGSAPLQAPRSSPPPPFTKSSLLPGSESSSLRTRTRFLFLQFLSHCGALPTALRSLSVSHTTGRHTPLVRSGCQWTHHWSIRVASASHTTAHTPLLRSVCTLFLL